MYNITRELLKKELTEKFKKYGDFKKAAQAQIDAATKVVSPKKKSKAKVVEETPVVDVEKLKTQIDGYDSIMGIVMTQLKEFKDRMSGIKALMDKALANSKPSSPAVSPSTSPRQSVVGTVTASPRANSPSSSPKRLTIGSRKPVVPSSVEDSSSRDRPTELPRSLSQPVSPRVTSFGHVSASSRVVSSDFSKRRLTIGSRKPASSLAGEESPPTSQSASPRNTDTVPEVVSLSPVLTVSSKQPKALPLLPRLSEEEVDVSKRDTVTLARESMVWPMPEESSTDQILGRGSLPVHKETSVTPDRSASLGRGRGRGLGRGKPVRPPAPLASPTPVVPEIDTNKLVSVENVQSHLKDDKKAASPVGSVKQTPTAPPRKASVGRGRGQPVVKPAVPKKVSDWQRKNSNAAKLLQQAKTWQLRDQNNHPELPKLASHDAPSELTTLPNLRIGTQRPKKTKQSALSTVKGSLSDEDEIIITGEFVKVAIPEGTKKAEVVVEDLSSDSTEEKPQQSKADNVNIVKKVEVHSDEEDDPASVDGQVNSEDEQAKEKQSPNKSEAVVPDTPRTAALKKLPDDKASRIFKAIISPGDFTKVMARQEYHNKELKAVDCVLKKFKGFSAEKIDENSYLFDEENADLRQEVVGLFDYLVVLQKEQLEWETPPARYHYKNNAEGKIEGLVEFFQTLADPNNTPEDAKKQLKQILASTEDKGLMKNRGTGAYYIGSFFRNEKNPVNNRFIRSTTERKLVQIYNALSELVPDEKDSFADPEVEQSDVDTAKTSR